jgi:PAS domain-containing protein
MERILGVIVDISEEKEKRFMMKSLLNELPGGVAIFRVSNGWECQLYNAGFTRLLGYSHDETEKLIHMRGFIEKTVYENDRSRVSMLFQNDHKDTSSINANFRYYSQGRVLNENVF